MSDVRRPVPSPLPPPFAFRRGCCGGSRLRCLLDRRLGGCFFVVSSPPSRSSCSRLSTYVWTHRPRTTAQPTKRHPDLCGSQSTPSPLKRGAAYFLSVVSHPSSLSPQKKTTLCLSSARTNGWPSLPPLRACVVCVVCVVLGRPSVYRVVLSLCARATELPCCRVCACGTVWLPRPCAYGFCCASSSPFPLACAACCGLCVFLCCTVLVAVLCGLGCSAPSHTSKAPFRRRCLLGGGLSSKRIFGPFFDALRFARP